jgi:hypothetical protein
MFPRLAVDDNRLRVVGKGEYVLQVGDKLSRWSFGFQINTIFDENTSGLTRAMLTGMRLPRCALSHH